MGSRGGALGAAGAVGLCLGWADRVTFTRLHSISSLLLCAWPCFAGGVFFLDFLHLIRSINDPEHPLTLEELNVVEQVRVKVNDAESTVSVEFTPTIPHCSMATLIGLSVKVKLIRSLPERFKVDVHITPGTHASEHAVNKQLADKERVAAALENNHLLEVVNQCLSGRP
ncbi:cytosolic iron-sulfur assembly component 2B isoform X1 [Podarcis muralis]